MPSSQSRLFRVVVPLLLAVYCVVLFGRRVDVPSAADGSGYLNQSRLWAERRLIVPLTLARQLNVPVELENVFTPLGFVRGPKPFTMVPSYPPGLPILMALARTAGGDAAPYFVVPVAGAATLLLLYWLARDLGIRRSYAVCAAAILGVCPVFLFMAIQPMSDVVAAFFAVAAMFTAFRGAKDARLSLLAGVCFGFGVLVRPTQILLLPALALAMGMRARSLIAFVIGAVPFAITQIAISSSLYGDPLLTGYGAIFRELRWSYFPVRFTHYCFWLAVILSPIIFPFGLFGLARQRVTARVRAALVAWLLPFLLFYCFYGSYEEWWYTRFLLPAIPSVILSAFLLFESMPHLIVAVAIAAVLVVEVGLARKFEVLDFAEGERVYKTAADMLKSHAPPDAIVLAMQHSGSLFYYTRRTPLRYDELTPATFASIRAHARVAPPFYALLPESDVPELVAKTATAWKPIAKVRDVVLLEEDHSSEP